MENWKSITLSFSFQGTFSVTENKTSYTILHESGTNANSQEKPFHVQRMYVQWISRDHITQIYAYFVLDYKGKSVFYKSAILNIFPMSRSDSLEKYSK